MGGLSLLLLQPEHYLLNTEGMGGVVSSILVSVKVMEILRRSHAPYHGWSVLITFSVVLVITLSIAGGTLLLGGSTNEIVKGVSIPGLSRSATASQWAGLLGQGFIGFVRLVPISDHAETGKIETPLKAAQNGSVFLASYKPIFTEKDLMNRLGSPYSYAIGRTYYRFVSERRLP